MEEDFNMEFMEVDAVGFEDDEVEKVDTVDTVGFEEDEVEKDDTEEVIVIEDDELEEVDAVGEIYEKDQEKHSEDRHHKEKDRASAESRDSSDRRRRNDHRERRGRSSDRDRRQKRDKDKRDDSRKEKRDRSPPPKRKASPVVQQRYEDWNDYCAAANLQKEFKEGTSPSNTIGMIDFPANMSRIELYPILYPYTENVLHIGIGNTKGQGHAVITFETKETAVKFMEDKKGVLNRKGKTIRMYYVHATVRKVPPPSNRSHMEWISNEPTTTVLLWNLPRTANNNQICTVFNKKAIYLAFCNIVFGDEGKKFGFIGFSTQTEATNWLETSKGFMLINGQPVFAKYCKKINQQDWSCRRCSFVNFGFRNSCWQCHEPCPDVSLMVDLDGESTSGTKQSQGTSLETQTKDREIELAGSSEAGTVPCTTLLFCGLNELTFEETLWQKVKETLGIWFKDMKIMRDPITKQSKSYAFGEVHSILEAEIVVDTLSKDKSLNVDGKKVFVYYAKKSLKAVLASLKFAPAVAAKTSNQNSASTAKTSTQNPATTAKTSTQNPVSPAKTASQTPASTAKTSTQNPASTVKTTTQNPASTVKTTTQNPASTAKTSTQNPASTAKTSTQNPASTVKTTTQNPASTVKTTTQNPASTAKTSTQNPASTAKTSTQNPASTVKTTTQNPARTAKASTQNPASTVKTTTQNPASTVKKSTQNPASTAKTSTQNPASSATTASQDSTKNATQNQMAKIATGKIGSLLIPKLMDIKLDWQLSQNQWPKTTSGSKSGVLPTPQLQETQKTRVQSLNISTQQDARKVETGGKEQPKVAASSSSVEEPGSGKRIPGAKAKATTEAAESPAKKAKVEPESSKPKQSVKPRRRKQKGWTPLLDLVLDRYKGYLYDPYSYIYYSSGPVKCPVASCSDRKILDWKSFQSHWERVHLSTIRSYYCSHDTCGSDKLFVGKHMFRNHLRTHTDIKQKDYKDHIENASVRQLKNKKYSDPGDNVLPPPKEVPGPNIDIPQTKCSVKACDQTYTTCASLKEHWLKYHSPKKIVYRCGTCDAIEQDRKSMTLHMKIHDTKVQMEKVGLDSKLFIDPGDVLPVWSLYRDTYEDSDIEDLDEDRADPEFPEIEIPAIPDDPRDISEFLQWSQNYMDKINDAYQRGIKELQARAKLIPKSSQKGQIKSG